MKFCHVPRPGLQPLISALRDIDLTQDEQTILDQVTSLLKKLF